jgi:ABC-type sugar transport system permease subunit
VTRRNYERVTFVLFVLPNVVLFGLFTYWPVLHSAWLSFQEWNLVADSPSFAGLRNYTELATDPDTWRVVLNTVVYAVCVVAVAQLAAFVLALLLNRPMPGRGFLRALAFTPYFTTTAAAALVFVLVLDPKVGPLSGVYGAAGLQGPDFLRSGIGSLFAVMTVGAWKEIGIATVFFLAGLQTIDRSLHESAALEGAGSWDRTRHITLPLLTPVIFFLALAGFIAALKMFDAVYIMTEGGPVYPESSTFVYHLYKIGFRDFRAGHASALAVVFFAAIVAITAVQFRLARRWVHYQ